MMKKLVVLIVIVLSVAGSIFLYLNSGPTSLTIYQSGGGLDGKAPVYKLIIEENGNVTYEGKAFVKELGKKNFKISGAAAERLIDKANDLKIFSMKNQYKVLPDSTALIFSYQYKRKNKDIVHDVQTGPAELRSFELDLIKTTGIDKFIK